MCLVHSYLNKDENFFLIHHQKKIIIDHKPKHVLDRYFFLTTEDFDSKLSHSLVNTIFTAQMMSTELDGQVNETILELGRGNSDMN